MRKALKIIFGTIVGLAVVAGIALALYARYLDGYYTRIEDHLSIANSGSEISSAELARGKSYTALSYNIGFGAYTPDYTFFMDTGTMADGTETRGERGRAVSEESDRASVEGALSVASLVNDGSPADFMLFQEVDVDSDRSYHINQVDLVRSAFPSYEAYYAENFHSGFLPLPITEPHGATKSGMVTLSDRHATSAERRSFPIDERFPWKYVDLDRCFTIQRFPVSDGKELVLINSHMSAYDEGGKTRIQQLKLFSSVLEEEYQAGNYVIAGGDWNHALCGSMELYPSTQQVPTWVFPLDNGELPDGFSEVRADNLEDVPSCRGDDIPYEEGVTYTVTVDGFIVSDNVRATAINVDTGFEFSDHNPVLLTFVLGREEI